MGISKLQGLWVAGNPHKFEIPAHWFPYKPPVNPCKHLQCSTDSSFLNLTFQTYYINIIYNVHMYLSSSCTKYSKCTVNVPIDLSRRSIDCKYTLNLCNRHSFIFSCKVLSLLEACFDLISSPSPSMKIQIMVGKITENLGFESPLWKVKKMFVLFLSYSNSPCF